MDFNNMSGYEMSVFCKLQKEGPLTKKELLNDFKYKPSTLNRIICSLLGKKLIVESGHEESSGGRKPSLFDINTNDKYVIGCDISRTYIYVLICDMKMNIKTSEMLFASFGEGNYTPETAVKSISVSVEKLLKKCSLTPDRIVGAGVGMVGPVDRFSGRTGKIDNFRDGCWSNVNFKEPLESALGCEVYIDNGSYAAVLGEYLYGGGKNYKSIAYFNCEVGIRSGSISSGVIIRAANNAEDSFSHTTINVMGERCFCGKRGCVICYASTLAISENIRYRIIAGEKSTITVPLESINYRRAMAAAVEGDSVAIDEIRLAGTYFGIGLANYITLLNPEYVVIDGPLIIENALFYDSAMSAVLLNAYKNTKIVFKRGGSFGYETIALGGAAMFLERMLKNPIMD